MRQELPEALERIHRLEGEAERTGLLLSNALDRARDLEAIANIAAERDLAVDAAIRRAAAEVARMTERSRTVAAMPKPIREAWLARR